MARISPEVMMEIYDTHLQVPTVHGNRLLEHVQKGHDRGRMCHELKTVVTL
jgi:hypothetical protein